MEALQRDLQRNELIRANCELTAFLNDLPGFNALRPSDSIRFLTILSAWSDEREQNVELLKEQCFFLQIRRGRPITSAPFSQLDSVWSNYFKINNTFLCSHWSQLHPLSFSLCCSEVPLVSS